MGTLSVKLSPALEAKLDALVKRRGQRKSTVVREAIERFVSEGQKQTSTTAFELLKDLHGTVQGPKDLSTNRKYFKGYGR